MIWLMFYACSNTEKEHDSTAIDTSVEDDTAVEELVVEERPEAMKGYFIDTERYPMAVCNDGSAPILYYRPGIDEGRDKWIIWFKGGQGCQDEASCLQRWETDRPLMTTCSGEDCEDFAIAEENTKNGILSASMAENPHFHN